MREAAYELVFQENRSSMYDRAPHCSDCSRVLDDEWIDPTFVLHQSVFDLSVTIDGCIVASGALVEACEGIEGAQFTPIDSEPGFYVLDVERVLPVEPFASRVRVGACCETCRGPRYAFREGPLRIAYPAVATPGFHRTDLTFGDTADFGREQPIRMRPTIVVDDGTRRILKSSGLRGVHLIPTD